MRFWTTLGRIELDEVLLLLGVWAGPICRFPLEVSTIPHWPGDDCHYDLFEVSWY